MDALQVLNLGGASIFDASAFFIMGVDNIIIPEFVKNLRGIQFEFALINVINLSLTLFQFTLVKFNYSLILTIRPFYLFLNIRPFHSGLIIDLDNFFILLFHQLLYQLLIIW